MQISAARSRRALLAAMVLSLPAAAVLGSGGPARADATPPVFSLAFDSPGVSDGTPITSPVITGSAAAALTSSVLTRPSATGVAGSAVLGDGVNAGLGDNAMRLPTYQDLTTNPPMAILSLTNSAVGATDPLDPGAGAFSWGADFSIDDNLGTVAADGDNLVQRGLTGATQWKLSADHHKAQCFVRSNATTVITTTPGVIIPNQTSNVTWYRALCVRSTTGTLTMTVSQYDRSTSAWQPFATTVAPTVDAGSLTMARAVPVAIGGKLNPNDTIVKNAPDQFNGLVDNVFLSIAGTAATVARVTK